ncbi:uncharacterized protein LOC106152008 [Lingula anatina]|uniref:Uncharacterized protein LOC106152008 n=1 Tax=Lingula anatina TaxID=7574 RepID=A0A1S3H4I1_LINAN|nr:uncharacterized protein LOC106152008 [Lingula anatina]|eukprot:XP_013380913.1 uncharacterized protein LOC106152008 [Lingula anatina]
MRMQNSSASSIITALIVMVAAVVTGILGIACRQVSCVTVTGIMYAIAAVFICLALAVYHAKLNNENPPSCSDVTQTISADICSARHVTHSWSIILAWISFTFNILASGWWLYLSRVIRMELMKTVNM